MEIAELVRVLKDVNTGKISERDALEKIKKASPLELTMAEEEILMEGMDTKHLQKFCKTHLESITDRLEDIKSELSENHPLFKLLVEHDRIIETVDNLDYLAGMMEERDLDDEEIETLQISLDNLMEKEKHHKREEELIFPKIRKKKINISVEDIEKDHEELHPKIKKLSRLSDEPNEHKDDVLELIYDLSFNIRNHVFQENVILYPAALNEIEDWDVIQAESEEIGYCSFKDVRKI